MKWRKYKSAVADGNFRSTVWMGLFVFMALMNIVLVFRVATTSTAEKTIVTPMSINKPFWIQGNEVSNSYLEQMGHYFSHLLLTFQKSNAKARFERVLIYVDPLIYNEMRARFMLEVDRIVRNNIASVFHPTKMQIRNDTAFITGEHVGMIGESVVSRGEKTYAMAFAYADSNLSITRFNEVRRNSSGDYEIIDPYKEVLISTGDESSQSDQQPAALMPAEEEARDANN